MGGTRAPATTSTVVKDPLWIRLFARVAAVSCIGDPGLAGQGVAPGDTRPCQHPLSGFARKQQHHTTRQTSR